MGRRRSLVLGLGALLVALVAGVLAYGVTHQPSTKQVAAAAPTGLTKGFRRFTAPRIDGRTLQGGRFSLAALRGRPVVINFWASWCGGCKTEAPDISSASRELGGQAHFVGVDVTDSASKALAFARSHGWSYPLVPDKHYAIADGYGVVGLPTTVFLDARGRVVDKIVGIATAGQIRAKLHALAAARA